MLLTRISTQDSHDIYEQNLSWIDHMLLDFGEVGEAKDQYSYIKKVRMTSPVVTLWLMRPTNSTFLSSIEEFNLYAYEN